MLTVDTMDGRIELAIDVVWARKNLDVRPLDALHLVPGDYTAHNYETTEPEGWIVDRFIPRRHIYHLGGLLIVNPGDLVC